MLTLHNQQTGLSNAATAGQRPGLKDMLPVFDNGLPALLLYWEIHRLRSSHKFQRNKLESDNCSFRFIDNNIK